MSYLIFPALFAVLFACNAMETKPEIVLGREWNSAAQVVADTASQFKPNDVIIIHIDNGKPFPAPEVELKIYQDGSNRVLFKRTSHVKDNGSKLTIKGLTSRPLTVKDILLTSTPGIYRVTFAVGDSVLAEKKMELVK